MHNQRSSRLIEPRFASLLIPAVLWLSRSLSFAELSAQEPKTPQPRDSLSSTLPGDRTSSARLGSCPSKSKRN